MHSTWGRRKTYPAVVGSLADDPPAAALRVWADGDDVNLTSEGCE